jgi:signal transduction histidine kinase
LAASIAHDLRNPLSAVVGGAEMIAEFDLPPDQMKQTSAQVYKAARRMEQLLSEIGQVARAEPGKRVRCEAAELVRSAVDSQEEKARARGVAVREDVDRGLAVTCEKSRVERVLVNLIANSLDVLTDGGEIRVAGRRNGSAVEIEVSDTGPGIPEEIRAKLFQPFVTKGKKNGLGLGLALARQTLLDHGGALELLDSGKGARFLVRLPAGESAG